MSARLAALAGALTVTMVCAGCDERGTATEAGTQAPLFTLSSGSQSTLLGRATFADPSEPTFKVKRISGDWHAEVKATPNLDIAVQRIVFSRAVRAAGIGIRAPCSLKWYRER